MKKIFNTAGDILGILIIIGAGVVLVLTLKGAHTSDEQSTTFQSPIEKVVAPTATILSPQQISPIATPTLSPMSAKATVAALGSQYKSEATPRPLTSINSSQDVVDVVLNDTFFQKYLDDSMFGPNSKDAIPGEPIFVTSLNPKKNDDYYLVPFYKDKQVSGIAVVGIEDGAGILGMWANASYDKFPVVDSEEARKLIEAEGFKVAEEPRLVFRWLREGGDETSPFWEVKTEKGIIFYVIRILNETKVYRANEVHPIGGG